MDPVLIVVPTSLIVNWQSEIAKFAPSLSVSSYTSSSKKFYPDCDVMLVTYKMLKNSILDICRYKYSLLIIDEAQNVKNSKTAGHMAVKCITADHVIAVTGTPVENSITDLHSLLDITNRGLFGSENFFKTEYDVTENGEEGEKKAKHLRRLVQPFMLRRLKAEVLSNKDLTSKTVVEEDCYLTPVQIGLYEEVSGEDLREIDALGEGKDVRFKRGSLILALMMKLKAICNSPMQYDKENPDKYKYEDSGKLVKAFSLIKDALNNNGNILIFTQFVSMGKILQRAIKDKFKIDADFLYGGLSSDQRADIVSRFQEEGNGKILLVSLKAGGTGLNLTNANYVIHYDLWWNPAVEDQATDRAHRLGQRRDVVVHRCICEGTFEERIDEIIQMKRSIAKSVVQSAEAWIGNLSSKELHELVKLSSRAKMALK